MGVVAASQTFGYIQATVDPLIKALRPGLQIMDSFAAGLPPSELSAALNELSVVP